MRAAVRYQHDTHCTGVKFKRQAHHISNLTVTHSNIIAAVRQTASRRQRNTHRLAACWLPRQVSSQVSKGIKTHTRLGSYDVRLRIRVRVGIAAASVHFGLELGHLHALRRVADRAPSVISAHSASCMHTAYWNPTSRRVVGVVFGPRIGTQRMVGLAARPSGTVTLAVPTVSDLEMW